MNPEQVIIAIVFAALGVGANSLFDRWRDRQRARDVRQAIVELLAKGFQVSFDKVTGVDVDTARQMELVRMTGYTVLKDGKPYGWRVTSR